MMPDKPTIGLLPLYLKLYDDTWPSLRDAFAPFLETIRDAFESEDCTVVTASICRVAAEFCDAVKEFEAADADCIVTLHLAYSPSLEAIDALLAWPRPIIMLDTTMDKSFGPDTAPDRIMFNHGIHGVQDLANLLRRHGKRFTVVAGHVTESELIWRASRMVRAARAARAFNSARVLRIGETFAGMGDFAVPDDALAREFGATVDTIDTLPLLHAVESVPEAGIDAELECDRGAYVVDAPDDVHRRSVRVGLGLRRLLDQGAYTAFTMNFLAFDESDGPLDNVPFLEASKAMARGLGYAGEGDALTAMLVGALNTGFGTTTFTEMFCPNWRGGSIFLSHMGEINPTVAKDKAHIVEKDFPWTPARNPATMACAPRQGSAVLANL
ncbi:MAG: hypothetical protein NTU83_10300, partial [Candidatus Hydrogenedentes bacterium]|nr:hypothetical protein [Candidatus Hydrogenedentota bacterium]